MTLPNTITPYQLWTWLPDIPALDAYLTEKRTYGYHIAYPDYEAIALEIPTYVGCPCAADLWRTGRNFISWGELCRETNRIRRKLLEGEKNC